MEEIIHRTVSVNGINMHIAEKGQEQGVKKPVVLFLHGFPELWYTWRNQILHLSSLGFHAVAPDLRGYGDTDAPASSQLYTCHHVVGDIVALIDHLGADQVFLVAHDWGALIGWHLCQFRPDRVKAFVCLSVPFRPRNPKIKPVDGMRLVFGEDYYMCRFQEPGVIEDEMKRAGTDQVLKKVMSNRNAGPPCIPKADQNEKPYGICPKNPPKLPSWISQEDLNYSVNKFDEKGFTGGLNYYRALDLSWELTAAWNDTKVTVPVKYVVGDEDMVYTTPGIKEYVHGGGFKKDVPLLEEIVVMEGVGHFLNQEKADEVNAHIYHFIKKFI
ncbi:Epoxide hydrolase A [Linum grandiflorum]